MVNIRTKLDELIKRSQKNMTQEDFAGWKGETVSFLKDNFTEDVEQDFSAVCGSKVFEIGEARQFLKNLRTIVR